MANAFQIVGLNNVVADLTTAGLTIQARSSGVLEAVGHRVEDTARALAPVRTGATAASIHTTMEDAQTVEVGPTTVQAIFMEWGTYKDAPQAFMGPALDRHSHELEAMLGLQVGFI